MPVETATAIDVDGFLHTGDPGVMAERAYLDRRTPKEMIIRGGENIYKREIEDRLFEHPPVGEAAVIGAGTRVWARRWSLCCGWLREREARMQWSYATGARRTWPVQDAVAIVPVGEFPATASGRIKKFELREVIETADAADRATCPGCDRS